jgi:hypothetical protein
MKQCTTVIKVERERAVNMKYAKLTFNVGRTRVPEEIYCTA